ncbi:enoyl-CoA hydratase/isomerase family protein [Rhodococcus sp. NPDC059968]|uniref:enoyl-CoA hydratase/isomerase family protein n=1 Tax=Rhodococcus sp. NPDC059968 TaxID=3347017 RepID=UPI003671268A
MGTVPWRDAVKSAVISMDGKGPADALLEVECLEHGGADIALIRFNRPASLNPMDKNTIGALGSLLSLLVSEKIDRAPDAIVLTGKGASFSAGGDLKGYQALYRDPGQLRIFMQSFAEVCHLLESCPSLTVAMINGTCVAGGLEISLACDLMTASETARIGDGHLKFAQLPGAGASQRLVKAVGSARASKWLLTGRLFDAAEAESAGLISLRAPLETLQDATLDLVAEIAQHSPLARRRMKELITIAETTDLTEGLAREADIFFEHCTQSYDVYEGLRAFADKRPARYYGR